MGRHKNDTNATYRDLLSTFPKSLVFLKHQQFSNDRQFRHSNVTVVDHRLWGVNRTNIQIKIKSQKTEYQNRKFFLTESQNRTLNRKTRKNRKTFIVNIDIVGSLSSSHSKRWQRFSRSVLFCIPIFHSRITE